MKLVDDKGLEEYDAVRAAYDKARTALTQENPDRKELSDLLGVLDKNPEGAKWLEAEVGEEYGKICKHVPAEKAVLVKPADSGSSYIARQDTKYSGDKISMGDMYDMVYIMVGGTIILGIFVYLSGAGL
jgi:hypothetical protein